MAYLASEDFDEASRDSVMQNYSNISIIKKLLRQPDRDRTQPLSVSIAGPRRSNEILDVTLSDTNFSQKSVTVSTEDEFWHALRKTNPSMDNSELSVGRVMYDPETNFDSNREIDNRWPSSVRTVTPELVRSLLTCLNGHFDLVKIFKALLGRDKTMGVRPETWTTRRPQMWYYSIKSYSLVCEGQTFYPWEESRDYGVFHDRIPGSYSSPWRVLILSSSGHDINHQQALLPSECHSGHEAFLFILNQEFADARRRIRQVFQEISTLVMPPEEFLFHLGTRDGLLFEDGTFTKSKTYFWSLQVITIMNDCIATIIDSWKSYRSYAAGDHFPPAQRSAGQEAADAPQNPSRKRIADLIACIDKQMEEFDNMMKLNSQKQNDIRALRDGLFSASAVQETRATVAQGKQIRLLTIISVAFLPIMFVTSLYSMPSLPASTDITSYAIAIPSICIPTYIGMTVLTSDRGVHFIHNLSYKLISCLNQYTLKIRNLRRTYLHPRPQRARVNIETNRVIALPRQLYSSMIKALSTSSTFARSSWRTFRSRGWQTRRQVDHDVEVGLSIPDSVRFRRTTTPS